MSVVDIKAPPEFETLQVLATAVAIHEYNNGYHKTTDDIIIDNEVKGKRFANREILRNQFLVDYYSNGASSPPLVKVRAEHFLKANEIQNYSKKEVFKLLGNQQGYTTDLYTIINSEYVNATHFGYIASAPFYYENGIKRDFYNDKIKNVQSLHVGLIGTKVHLDDFEIIKNAKSNNFPGYVVQGICEGNLFLFFSRHDVWGKYKIGDKINIYGTVKDHVMEQSTVPMTKLNRVYERVQSNNGPIQVKYKDNFFDL